MKVRTETLKYRDVVLLDEGGRRNARFMPHTVYRQLVENLKKDGALTQIPFCVRWVKEGDKIIPAAPGERWLVLSGNHRVKAARDAGLDEGMFLVTDDALTWEEATAIQVSHNAISGQDDPAVLKDLYESIRSVDLKLYAGLDAKTLELLAKVGTEPAPTAKLEWTAISLLFLPDEAEALKKVLALAMDLAKGEAFAARMKDYEPFMEAITIAAAAHNITNSATALGLVLALFQRHLTDLQEGWVVESEGEARARHKGWVPLATVFGSTSIPPDAALVLRRALGRALDQGDVKPESKWRLLELLAADYLAS